MSDIPISISASGAGQVSGQFSDIERAAMSAQSKLDNFGSVGGISAFIGRVRDAKSELGGLTEIGDMASGFGAKMAGVGAGAGAALVGGLKMSLDAFGEVQVVKAGLETQLGSKDAAEAMFGDIQKFGQDSPFDMLGSAKGAQRLLAVGTAANEVLPTLNAVGNAVAGAGGDSDAFQGVLTALGQIRSKGKLSQEELNQITERGISMQFLADKLGLTAEQMGNIGNEGIGAERAIRAIVEGFSEIGGGEAMAKQMKTIPGQMSTLGDSATQAAAAVGEVFSADASNLIGNLTKLVDKGAEFIKQHPDLTRNLVIGGGALAGGGALLGGGLMIAGSVANGATQIMALTKAFKGSKTAADGAASAKKGLLDATLGDLNAEKNKIGVAKGESKALDGTAGSALLAAAAKGDLTEATDEAKNALSDLASEKIEELIDDPKEALNKWKDGLKDLQTQVKNFKPGNITGGFNNFLRNGSIGGMSLGTQALAIPSAGTGLVGNAAARMGIQAGTRTVGQVGGAAAVGAFAGWGIADSLKNNTDMDEGTANAIGAGSGLAVAALTIAAPTAILPIAAAVAVGKAVEYGINKYYNEPMEKAAEAGTGADNEEVMGEGMNDKLVKAQKAVARGEDGARSQMADVYNEMAAKAREAGDDDSAQAFLSTALSQKRIEKKEGQMGTEEFALKQGKKTQEWKKVHYPEFEAGLKQNQREMEAKGVKFDDGSISNAPKAKTQTQGDVMVEVRVKRGDTAYERDARQYGANRRRG